MRLLRLAVEVQRWDLAAHTIVLAAATTLKNGDRPDGQEQRKKVAPQRATKTLGSTASTTLKEERCHQSIRQVHQLN